MSAHTIQLEKSLDSLERSLDATETLCQMLASQMERRRAEIKDIRRLIKQVLQNPIVSDPSPPDAVILHRPNRLVGLIKGS